MKQLFIAILLCIIPIMSFIFQYFLSKKNNSLKYFRNNNQVYYLDWFFVPFNFIYAYAITINFKTLTIFILFSLIGNIYLHFNYWLNLHLKEKKKAHMYDLINKKLSSAGWIHLIFSIFQTLLIVTFLFTPIKSLIDYAGLLFLFMFFAGFFYTSKKLHGKIITSDLVVGVAGILVIFIKVMFYFYFT